MSYIVLAGPAYYPSGWSDFRGHFSSIQEIEHRMPLWIAEAAWMEVINTDTWVCVARYEADYPRCDRCGGKGSLTKWIDGFENGVMKPSPLKFPCSQCSGGLLIHKPKVWRPHAD